MFRLSSPAYAASRQRSRLDSCTVLLVNGEPAADGGGEAEVPGVREDARCLRDTA
jgi:hypothetical protein